MMTKIELLEERISKLELLVDLLTLSARTKGNA